MCNYRLTFGWVQTGSGGQVYCSDLVLGAVLEGGRYAKMCDNRRF